MELHNYKISKVFSQGGDIHYVMPPFQRQYSWEKTQWETLLTDVIDIYHEYESDENIEHFLGSLVVIDDQSKGVMSCLKLVDGQQRLTTISLLLAAVRDLLEKSLDDQPEEQKNSLQKLADKINKSLVNNDEEGDLHFKILPTKKYGDRLVYQAILQKNEIPKAESSIGNAYRYFYQELEPKLSKGELAYDKVFEIIQKCFQVVFIQLGRQENPYHIFESLNAKGKPLTQADLVRNYIAMTLSMSEQEKVFYQHWEKIEKLLNEERKVGAFGELTAFLRHYLAVETRNLCSEEHIYARFRDYCKKFNHQQFVEKIADLQKYSEYYNKLLRPHDESKPEIQKILIRLNILDSSTAYPFLLKIYSLYDSQEIGLECFLDILQILENYLIRRYICNKASNYLNKMFPALWKDIEKVLGVPKQLEGLPKTLGEILSSKEYPNDHEVREAIRTKQFKDKSKLRLVLETINRHLSKDMDGFTALDKDATIEHILPQKCDQNWKTYLGKNWQEIQKEYLNNLGNLTLVSGEWNSELSNSPFANKKEKLARHVLLINCSYFNQNIERWDDQAIKNRAEFLTEKFLEIWSNFANDIDQTTTKKTSIKPKSLSIKGELINLTDKTWKSMTVSCCEWVWEKYPEKFSDFIQNTSDFKENYTYAKGKETRYHQLSNGWWVNVNKNSEQHIKFCRRLLESVGIDELEWSYET